MNGPRCYGPRGVKKPENPGANNYRISNYIRRKIEFRSKGEQADDIDRDSIEK